MEHKATSHANANVWGDFFALRRLWPHFRRYKKTLGVAIGLIPVISLLQMLVPMILRWSIDSGIAKKDMGVITLGAIGFVGAIVLEYFARGLQRYTTSISVYGMVKSLRKRLITHILRLSPSFHDRSLSGALVTRATSDFDNLSESLNQGVLGSVIDVAVLGGSVVGLFLLNWRMALVMLIFLPVMGVVITSFSKALKRAMLDARRKLAQLNAFTQECLYGNSTLKMLTAQSHAQQRYDVMAIDYRDTQMKSVVLDALMFSVIDGMSSVTIGVVLWCSVGYFFDSLSAGIIVASVQYIGQIFEPLKQLGSKIAMLQGAFTAMDRIFGVLAEDEKMSGSEPAPEIQGRVDFRHVNFSYRKKTGSGWKHGPAVLRDVSFSMEPGQSLALVGATGSGKSSIVKLLTKLYEGYSGEILLDGQSIAPLDPESLRRQVTIVPQDIVLFDGTIAFNIGLGKESISRKDIEEAATAVGADQFIERLPGGLDFPIREQGGNLSHGQRQLITFARALVMKPRLVILDEATSSVDAKSEAMIQSAIEKILKGRTVIVIAHRLSTIRHCDEILVLHKGEVVERGNHRKLLEMKGRYFNLHEA